eukprot:scaffold691_cov50-Cyclotella_meneghiniana.AAC.2
MKFSTAIIFLATLSDVSAQTGTKSTKSDGKSTKTAKSAKVTSAPVTSAPVSSAPVTSAPVTSAPVTSAPVTSAPVTSSPTQCPTLPCNGPIGPLRCTNNGYDNCVNGCCVRNPTSAPVTSAPVTLAPVTSAPTSAPTVALTYSPVGPGEPRVLPVWPLSWAQHYCSAKCTGDLNHPHLVGFGTSTAADNQSCFCYYSGGVTPKLPVPNDARYNQYLHPGNGPIMNRTGSPITSGATKAPITPSPTGAAPPASLTYSLLGAGFCQDSSGNKFDEVGGPQPRGGVPNALDCSKFCGQFASPDLLGFPTFPLDQIGFSSIPEDLHLDPSQRATVTPDLNVTSLLRAQQVQSPLQCKKATVELLIDWAILNGMTSFDC